MEQQTTTHATEQINRNLGTKAHQELLRMIAEKNGHRDKGDTPLPRSLEPGDQHSNPTR